MVLSSLVDEISTEVKCVPGVAHFSGYSNMENIKSCHGKGKEYKVLGHQVCFLFADVSDSG